MRPSLFVPVLLLLCTQALASSSKSAPAENENSISYKYNMEVHRLLQAKVKPEFSPSSERLEVEYEFYLDSRGRVTSLNTHAKAGGRRAEQILERSIRALKCPPVPPQVFKELAQDPPLKIFGTLSWDPPAPAQAGPAEDATLEATVKGAVDAMLQAEAPYIVKGRATYPKAKQRYLASLPPGDSFAVRRRLTEPGTHHTSGVYVEVDAIKNGKIEGRIVGDPGLPSFHQGQRISFPESELLDWAIFHPDGSVEGNVLGKFLEKARSPYTNDMALSSDDVTKIKRACHAVIGLPFQDATLWRELQPFVRSGSDFYKPITTCGGDYCSGGLRLRDGSEVLYTYLHIPPKGNKSDNGDITPDLGRKGNNRIIGVKLIRHGKTILSEGHLDQNTVDLYRRHRESPKSR